MELSRLLMRVLGGRAFWTFVLVTFLMAGLLASVNLASRFALKSYVDDQFARTPWDFTVFQMGGRDAQDPTIVDKIRSVQDVSQVEVLSVLRARLPGNVSATLVDGQPLQTPWLTVMAASDPGLLPPQLRTFVENPDGSLRVAARPILALVGSDQSTGHAFRALQGSREFSIEVRLPDVRETIFRSDIGGVVRLDRTEMSRWLMDQTGGPVYLPPTGAVLLMPYDLESNGAVLRDFDRLARGTLPHLHRAPAASADGGEQENYDELHVQKGDYLPEVIYVARMDRESLVSGWDIEGSLSNVMRLGRRVLAALAPGAGLHASSGSGPRPKPILLAMASPSPSSGYPDIASDLSPLFEQRTDEPLAGMPSPASSSFGQWGSVDSDNTGYRIVQVHEPGEPEPPMAASGYRLDSTTQVLLQQMQGMARLIGVVTLLIAIPLLWMAWMLATNLSSLLMLNERRILGLMRLRGVPGKQLGRSLLTAVASGGFLGGLLGIVLGSILVLLLFERGSLPLAVLLQPQQLILLGLFLLITVVLSLLVSSRLINYATTISPLEASGRFASSETGVTRVRFGALHAASLLIGAVVLAGWVFGFSPADAIPYERLRTIAILMDFLALPLFLYGVITLLASRRSWIEKLVGPFQGLIGGRLALLTRRHMAAKPHRSVAFLMIVGLMASISLYPTVASVSFEDKAVRGAQVQMGSDWRFTFNSPDIVTSVGSLRGGVREQLAAIGPGMQEIVAEASQVDGVQSVDYMVEALLPNFYMPGAGMGGVPLYLLEDVAAYSDNAYSEPELGIGPSFRSIVESVRDGGVAVSPAIKEFWQRSEGELLRIGVDSANETVSVPLAGALGHLPGMPARAVTDRQGYVQARVDYLNHLFGRAAYAAIAADNPQIEDLQIAVPRIVLMVNVEDSVAASPDLAAEVHREVLASFGTDPLDAQLLSQELRKVGGSMFVALAVENMKIYLVGGILLALIAIFSVALANYAEDRRTLGLLRIRGTSLKQLQRFLATMLVSPAVLGLLLGIGTALIAGYGLTNRVWEIREIQSVVQLLSTHLVTSNLTFGIAALLLALVVFAAWIIGLWVFRRATTALQ